MLIYCIIDLLCGCSNELKVKSFYVLKMVFGENALISVGGTNSDDSATGGMKSCPYYWWQKVLI